MGHFNADNVNKFFRIGRMVDDARCYCWVHREEPAMQIIAKARQAAGIKPPGKEFDWETVPLESLERR